MNKCHIQNGSIGWLWAILILLHPVLTVVAQDSDADGMPDAWEQTYHLDWQIPDALGDPDNDQLNNLDEYYAGCDPHSWDSDGDQLPDGWEVERGRPPMDAGVRAGVLKAGILGHLDTVGWSRRLAVWSNRLLLADGVSGLHIIDISAAENPAVITNWSVSYPEEVRSVAVHGDELCVALWGRESADWVSAVAVLSMTSNVPVLRQRLPVELGRAWSVSAHSNGFAVGVLDAGGSKMGVVPRARVRLLDYDGTNWVNVGELGAPDLGFASRVRFGADRLYVSDRQGGLSIWPEAPTGETARVSIWTSVDMVEDVIEDGGCLYLACGTNGVLALGLSDYGIRHRVNPPGYAVGLAVQSNLLWVAMGTGGVACLDISVPSWPVLIDCVDTLGFAEDVLVVGETVWVADGSNGLVSLSMSDVDTDDDGMSDDWETARFATLARDGSGDLDGDGLCDRSEFLAGLNPGEGDGDSDGTPDGWEVRYGLNPLLEDVGDDPDNDGYTNYAEWIAGTHPRDACSVFRLSGLSFGSDGMRTAWWGASGRLYRLYATLSLTGAYETVMVITQMQDGQLSYTNPAGMDTRFFRVQVEQLP